jgi:hypothetical protein
MVQEVENGSGGRELFRTKRMVQEEENSSGGREWFRKKEELRSSVHIAMKAGG